MDIRECYLKLGGDYDTVFKRLPNEKLIERFILKFLEDGSFELLKKSIENENYEEAFRAAHTLKGVCQNLGFDKLFVTSEIITNALRNHSSGDFSEMLAAVSEDYEITVSSIKEFANGSV